MTRRPIIAALVLCVTGLGLVGCMPDLTNVAGGVVEELVEQTTDQAVDVGHAAELPDDWPADVPVPDGALFSAISVDGTHSLSYMVAEADAAERLVEDLIAAGFATESNADFGGLSSYGLTRSDWQATVGVLGDEGEFVLSFTITPAA